MFNLDVKLFFLFSFNSSTIWKINYKYILNCFYRACRYSKLLRQSFTILINSGLHARLMICVER